MISVEKKYGLLKLFCEAEKIPRSGIQKCCSVIGRKNTRTNAITSLSVGSIFWKDIYLFGCFFFPVWQLLFFGFTCYLVVCVFWGFVTFASCAFLLVFVVFGFFVY